MIWPERFGESPTTTDRHRLAVATSCRKAIPPTPEELEVLRDFIVGLAALVTVSTPAEAAGDAAAGKKVMGKCQVCHGKDGLAKLPDAPNIAGQKESYLVRALKSFKAGKRENAQMTVVTKGLSDEDIANVAAYYSSIKITVEVPP
jgi:cytochrome c553